MAEVPQENDIISVFSTSSEEDYKEDEDEEAAAATVAAAAMSTPPRRSTRSCRVSLSPSNTETTITETRSSDEKIEGDICIIYDVIKHDGWMRKNGKLFNWLFVPPAINKLIQDKEITYKDLLSKGTDGDHYAEGWMKLGEMFLTYGTNHAPKNLSRSPPNPLLEGYTIERLRKELICEVTKKPAAASKSTESVGVGDTFTPVGSISTGSTSTGSTPAVSEADSNATKRKQDESKSTSSRKKKKNSPASSTAAAAGRVSPIEWGLLNASNFFEETQKRYFELGSALETAKKNQEAENKELVNKVRGLEGQMKEKGEELSAMMAQLTEKTDAMKHLEDKVEALKRGKLALDDEVEALKRGKLAQDDEVEALKRGKHALETENRQLKSDMERLRRRSSPPSDDEDILRGLDKELIEKINNQIVNNGEEVTLDQIAGLENAKETVHQLVTYPMERPDLFTGLRACPKGLLLFGPPGTGKTTIAKAIAHESGATFFSLSSSDLTSKWLGEGEKLIKTLFAVAAYQAPSVVFVDEVDSMLTQRRADEDDAMRRMKTEFLVQLDGAGNRREGHVLVMGATNRPQDLDEAARRRFAKRLYLPLPNQQARETLLRTLVAKNSHSLTDDDFVNLSRDTEGYSGADLKNLCNDASFGPIRTLSREAIRSISPDDVPPISYEHFCHSLRITSPSVGQEDLQAYVDWSNAHGTKPDFLGN